MEESQVNMHKEKKKCRNMPKIRKQRVTERQ